MKKNIYYYMIVTSIVFMLAGYWCGHKFVWTPLFEMNSLFNTLRAGDFLYEDGDYIRAIAILNRTVAYDPDNAFAHLGLADTYSLNMNYEFRRPRRSLSLGKQGLFTDKL